MKNVRPFSKGQSLKRGDCIEVTISALDEDGYGIGATSEAQVRIRGALPGERVRALIEHVGKHRITATINDLLQPAASRIVSPCAKAMECESCPLIAMDYQAQLVWKEQLVSNHVHRYRRLAAAAVLPVIPSPRTLGYRNSAKLVVGGKYAAPVIGLYKRDSHDILALTDCPLHHPLINRIVAATREGIIKGKVPVFNPRSQQGLLRYLVIRIAERENRAMVVLVTARRSYNEMHHLATFIRKTVPEVVVVAQNVNPSSGNVILGNQDYFLTKDTSLRAMIDDVTFLVSPRSFFQINSGSAAIIYNLVRTKSGLNGSGTLLDLYCGTGAISLFLSKLATSAIGIEVNDAAIEDARLNAKINQARNCLFTAGDVAKEIQAVVASGIDLDLVVLNPPRKGCEEQVLQQIGRLRPKRIVYVSCSPATLARDLDQLDELGFTTESVQPVDMFPQTLHIESVAVLNRRQER